MKIDVSEGNPQLIHREDAQPTMDNSLQQSRYCLAAEQLSKEISSINDGVNP